MSATGILMDAGLDKSHWGIRIILAEGRGEFNGVDRSRANGWTTCACGGLDESLMMAGTRVPKDGRLLSLGGRFSIAVSGGQFEKAAVFLVEIMDRAWELLVDQS